VYLGVGLHGGVEAGPRPVLLPLDPAALAARLRLGLGAAATSRKEEAHQEDQQEERRDRRVGMTIASCLGAEERRARAHTGGLGRVLHLPPNRRHNRPRLTSSISQTEGAKAWTSLLYAWIETERVEGECEQG